MKTYTFFSAGKKLALLIGNGQYGPNPLSTPINDSQKLALELQKIGFQCLVLVDLTLSEIRNTVLLFSYFIEPDDYGKPLSFLNFS